jgi:hypothetical protein
MTPSYRLFALFFLFASTTAAATPDVSSIQSDLITPKVITGDPRPGKRVFQSLPGYEVSNVRHALYLPTDWGKGKSYPVIAEYTGNNGTVAGGKAAQGYGISGGKAFIWVTLPFVSEDGITDMDWWWGDPDRTASYAVKAVESICENWGGDPNAVILTGHSRGAIACNYIGLRNDKIAKLWLGMVPVSHYDNRRWGQTEAEQVRRVERLLRLGNTPQYVCGEYHLTENHKDQKLLSLVQEGNFATLAEVKRHLNIESILDQEGIRSHILQNHPTAKVTFDAFPWVNHYGDWILRDTPSREKLRSWVHDLVGR